MEKITSVAISKQSVDFIVNEEVTSPSVYLKKYSSPNYPGGDSGVTIGIGYDLGYNTTAQIKQDWIGVIPANEINLLTSVAGLKCDDAKAALYKVRTVKIPYAMAYMVFKNKTLPRYIRSSLAIYPGLEQLLPDAIGGIVSMVFNRGNSLRDNPKHPELKTRMEMRNIVPLVASKDYAGIAREIEASKRLWEGGSLKGLIDRRIKEAELVANAQHDYAPEDVFNIVL